MPVLVHLKKYYDVNIIVYFYNKALIARAAEETKMFSVLCDTADTVYLYRDAFEGNGVISRAYRWLLPATIQHTFDNIKIDALIRVYTDMTLGDTLSSIIQRRNILAQDTAPLLVCWL